MLRVVTGNVVALGPEAFDESVGWPALKGQSAGFDALHERRAWDERFVGFAHGGVAGFHAGVEDGGGLPFALAGVLCQ